MARGVGSGVVMQQPVRARRWTLVLHTPHLLPSAGPRDGGRCKLLRQRATWVAECFAVCGQSLLPFPLSWIREAAGTVLHQLPCDGRRSRGALRTDPSNIEGNREETSCAHSHSNGIFYHRCIKWAKILTAQKYQLNMNTRDFCLCISKLETLVS